MNDESAPGGRFRVARDLLFVAGGKLFALGSLFACNLLAARACGPAEYGLYSAGLALALLLDATVGSPLDLASVRFGVVHKDDPDRVLRFQAAAFRLKLALGGLGLLVAAIAGTTVAGAVLGDASRTRLLVVAVLGVVALLVLRSTAAYLQLEMRFRLYSSLDTLQGVLRLVMAGAAFVLGSRSADLYLSAYGASAFAVFAIAALRQPPRYLRAAWPSAPELRDVATYGGLTAGIVVLGTLTGRADIPLLAGSAPAEEAGHYAVAAQISMLVTLLAMYGSVVLQPRVIPAAREGGLGRLMRWNAIGAAGIAAVSMLAAVFLLPLLVPMAFGPGYQPAVPLLRILLIGTCADVLFMPVPMTFAMQLFPRAALAGEAAITAGFFLAVPAALAAGPVGLAWLVTAVRLAKAALYLGIMAARGRRAIA